jgi:hypothetical protein
MADLIRTSVAGQDMSGTYPLLQIDGPDDVGGSCMIPTTSRGRFSVRIQSVAVSLRSVTNMLWHAHDRHCSMEKKRAALRETSRADLLRSKQ